MKASLLTAFISSASLILFAFRKGKKQKIVDKKVAMTLSTIEEESLTELREGVRNGNFTIYTLWSPFQTVVKRRAIMSRKKDGGKSFIELVSAAMSTKEVATTPSLVDLLSAVFVQEMKEKIKSIEASASPDSSEGTAAVPCEGEKWCQWVSTLDAALMSNAEKCRHVVEKEAVVPSVEEVLVTISHIIFLQQVLNADGNTTQWLASIGKDFRYLLSVPSEILTSACKAAPGDYFLSNEKILLQFMHWAACETRVNQKDFLPVKSEGSNTSSPSISNDLSSSERYSMMIGMLTVADQHWQQSPYQLFFITARFIFELLLRRESARHLFPPATRAALLGNCLPEFTISDEEAFHWIAVSLDVLKEKGDSEIAKLSDFMFLRTFFLVVSTTQMRSHGKDKSYKVLIDFLIARYKIDSSILGKLNWRSVAYGATHNP